jgi:hypothetical protein
LISTTFLPLLHGLHIPYEAREGAGPWSPPEIRDKETAMPSASWILLLDIKKTQPS